MALKDKYVVSLAADQCQTLGRMTRAGTHAARALAHARMLLLADASPAGDAQSDVAIAQAVGVHSRTVARVAALRRVRPRRRPAPQAPNRPAISQARRRAEGPPGRPGLLRAAGGAGPLDAPAAGRQAGRVRGRRLDRPLDGLPHPSKDDLQPWPKQQRVIPPGDSGAFVAAMEDVIEVDHQPPVPVGPHPVPEPSSVALVALLGLGVGAMGLHARRRAAMKHVQ